MSAPLASFNFNGWNFVPMQMAFILTVIILAGFIGRATPPRAGGEPYVKER